MGIKITRVQGDGRGTQDVQVTFSANIVAIPAATVPIQGNDPYAGLPQGTPRWTDWDTNPDGHPPSPTRLTTTTMYFQGLDWADLTCGKPWRMLTAPAGMDAPQFGLVDYPLLFGDSTIFERVTVGATGDVPTIQAAYDRNSTASNPEVTKLIWALQGGQNHAAPNGTLDLYPLLAEQVSIVADSGTPVLTGTLTMSMNTTQNALNSGGPYIASATVEGLQLGNTATPGSVQITVGGDATRTNSAFCGALIINCSGVNTDTAIIINNNAVGGFKNSFVGTIPFDNRSDSGTFTMSTMTVSIGTGGTYANGAAFQADWDDGSIFTTDILVVKLKAGGVTMGTTVIESTKNSVSTLVIQNDDGLAWSGMTADANTLISCINSGTLTLQDSLGQSGGDNPGVQNLQMIGFRAGGQITNGFVGVTMGGTGVTDSIFLNYTQSGTYSYVPVAQSTGSVVPFNVTLNNGATGIFQNVGGLASGAKTGGTRRLLGIQSAANGGTATCSQMSFVGDNCNQSIISQPSGASTLTVNYENSILTGASTAVASYVSNANTTIIKSNLVTSGTSGTLSGVTNAQLFVDLTKNFSILDNTYSKATGLSTITPLDINANARPQVGSDNSTTFLYVGAEDAFLAPTLTVSNVTTTTATFTWSGGSGGVGSTYVEPQKRLTGVNPYVGNGTQTSPYVFPGLTGSTTYDGRLSVTDNQSNSVLSTVVVFTTAAASSTGGNAVRTTNDYLVTRII